MAKVINPLMSTDASGQFAKSMIFAKWKGIQYVREYVIPANPDTSGQQLIRGYFQTAVAAWKNETSNVKTAWTDYANGQGLQQSGFNLYVGEYIHFLRQNSGTPPTHTDTPPTMS